MSSDVLQVGFHDNLLEDAFMQFVTENFKK